MSLDEDFVAVAKEHGWNISFNGTLHTYSGLEINDFKWIEEVEPGEKVDLVLGLNSYERKYEFVCPAQNVAQTIAVCQESRCLDYHSELLEAVALHLRQFQPGVSVGLDLPAALKKYVDDDHGNLLINGHPEYHGGVWPIFTEGSGEIIDSVSDGAIPMQLS